MKRAVAASLFTLLAVTAFAQARDFSGRWVIDVERTAAAKAKADDWIPASHDITISMDAKTMSVVSTSRSGLTKRTYNLDGSESKNATAVNVGLGASTPTAVVSTAKWQGDTLVVSTKLYSTTATEKYSMDGDRLKFEFSNPQMTPPVVTVIYKRTQ